MAIIAVPLQHPTPSKKRENGKVVGEGDNLIIANTGGFGVLAGDSLKMKSASGGEIAVPLKVSAVVMYPKNVVG